MLKLNLIAQHDSIIRSFHALIVMPPHLHANQTYTIYIYIVMETPTYIHKWKMISFHDCSTKTFYWKNHFF